MAEIPKSWRYAPLSFLTFSRKGKKPDTLYKKSKSGLLPYLDIKAIETGHVDNYASGTENLKVSESDLLVVWDGSRSGWVGLGTVGVAGSTIMVLTPLLMNTKYLYRFLQSKFSEINSNTKGSGIPHVDSDVFWNIQIPIPPLEEQHQIVSKIENIIQKTERSIQNINNSLNSIGDYKVATYKTAIEGDLTRKWRDSFSGKKIQYIKPLKDYAGILSEIPSTWEIVPLNSLLQFIGSGTTPSGGDLNYLKVGIPFLRSQNIYPEEIVTDNLVYISKTLNSEMKRSQILGGDVLLNITGASIGRAATVPSNFGPGNVNQHVCILRCDESIVPEYLSLYLNSPHGQHIIMQLQRGATRQGLNYSQIRSIPIVFPPLEEQKEIVKLSNEKILNYTENVKTFEVAKAKVEDLLKKSISDAFSGKLVPQLKNVKPVDSLLKEIEVERAKLKEDSAVNLKKLKVNRNLTRKKVVTIETKDDMANKISALEGPIHPKQLWLITGKMPFDKFYELLKLCKKDQVIEQTVKSIEGEIVDESFTLNSPKK